MMSPFLREGTNLLFESPCVGRLLVELPVGFRHRLRPHQPARLQVFQRCIAFPFADSIAYPCGIDTRINYQVRDVYVLRSQLARSTLCNRAKAELRTCESRISHPA